MLSLSSCSIHPNELRLTSSTESVYLQSNIISKALRQLKKCMTRKQHCAEKEQRSTCMQGSSYEVLILLKANLDA